MYCQSGEVSVSVPDARFERPKRLEQFLGQGFCEAAALYHRHIGTHAVHQAPPPPHTVNRDRTNTR